MAITIQIVGHKNSGKTAVTTSLIKQLTRAGYRVASIKHDAHTGTMDYPGTDSARMTAAGAHQVILEADGQFFFHQRGAVPPLAELVQHLVPDNDFIIIEGHKAASYPKIYLLQEGEQPDSSTLQNCICRPVCILHQSRIDDQQRDKLVKWIVSYLNKEKRDELH